MPQRFSMALLMLVMVRMVSSASPPSVSATRGTKSVPEEWHAERLAASVSASEITCVCCSFTKKLYGRLLWVKLANYPRVHMYSLQSVCEREYESPCEPVDCTIILSPLIGERA